MAHPDNHGRRDLPGLRGKLALARLSLAWEALWPALWPATGISGLFIVLALFDILPALPGWLHAVILFAFVVALGWAVVGAVRRFIWPALQDGRRRIEQASGLAHRPLTAVDDALAAGGASAAGAALWKLHQQRMAESARQLRVGVPEPGLARRDPLALRAGLAVLLVVAVVAGWSEPTHRLARAFLPSLGTVSTGPQIVLDVWITPPDYTGMPPLFPLRLAAQERKPDATTARAEGAPAGAATAVPAGPPSLQVPTGSVLTVQIQGERDKPYLLLGDAKVELEPVDATYSRIVRNLTDSGRLAIVANDRTMGEWNVRIIPDNPPAIDFANDPAGTPQATLRVSYTASDDYGVAKARAEFRRTYERGEVVGKETHTVELPLPSLNARSVNETGFFDLAPHNWAGLPVILKLHATDALGQQGESREFRLTLPERVFTHPVARAIIEQRKRLANQPERRQSIVQALAEIASVPEAFAHDSVVFLALVTARSRLIYESGDDSAQPTIDLLWDTALRLEDGRLSIAERELRRIQQELMKALAEGKSDAELERLMQELQRAIARYMQALQEQMMRNPNAQQQVMEFDPRTMRLIQPGDLQRMLDQIRQLMQSGARQAAREMLARLQQMLEGMRSMQVMRMRGGGQRNGTMQQLQQLIQRQQQLMERTFPFSQPGNRPQGGMPGPADQQALQRMLQQLRNMMQGMQPGNQPGQAPGQGPGQALDRANQEMENAIRALQGNQPGDAVGAQGRALEQLRQAGRGMLQQMMERFARESGQRPGQQNRNAPRRDPLGRETMGSDVETEGVKIPDEGTVQRAREILDELRRRSGQIDRRQIELDYINRLLQRF